MANDELTISDYVGIFRRRKLLFTGSIFFVVLGFIALAYILPATYYSFGTILIEQQDVPEDLVRSTVTAYADERLQVITQHVMTAENVARIIERHDLYPSERSTGLKPTDLIDVFKEDTSLETLSADVSEPNARMPYSSTIAFMVGYRSTTAAKAQAVANDLVKLYLEENARNRTETATETTAFLSRRAGELKSELGQMEQQLAGFKEQYGSSLPEFQRLNLDRLETTEREMADLQLQIRTLRDARDLQSAELSIMSPFAAYDSEEGVISDPRRLDQLQRDYIALASKYGPSHPDLVRVRREIELLSGGNVGADLTAIEEELATVRSNLESAQQRLGANHPDVLGLQGQLRSLEVRRSEVLTRSAGTVTPTNPLYIQKQGQLNSTANQLTAAEQRLAALTQRRDDYEQRLQLSPEVERNYTALAREHEAKLAQFRELQGKLEAATLAETLETEQRGERFTMTNPPLLPTDPESPNRIAIVLLGFVVAVGAGIGLVLLSESLDTTVRGPKDIVHILNAEPIASINYIEGPADVRKRRGRYALVGGAALASIAVVAVVIQAAG